ncbi:hypothetical protein VHEMI10743 [[Torrubiella] hemipterigena]|uniref:Uncharacterized protein n=1 Tax=[Torrubiella] hemipterigena TaxID=1531966 RepID=A0A0A1TTP1_9HYPO|nr:hypothetical protein VHEMI10743 [[Torrubiella] hemipterigena]
MPYALGYMARRCFRLSYYCPPRATVLEEVFRNTRKALVVGGECIIDAMGWYAEPNWDPSTLEDVLGVFRFAAGTVRLVFDVVEPLVVLCKVTVACTGRE